MPSRATVKGFIESNAKFESNIMTVLEMTGCIRISVYLSTHDVNIYLSQLSISLLIMAICLIPLTSINVCLSNLPTQHHLPYTPCRPIKTENDYVLGECKETVECWKNKSRIGGGKNKRSSKKIRKKHKSEIKRRISLGKSKLKKRKLRVMKEKFSNVNKGRYLTNSEKMCDGRYLAFAKKEKVVTSTTTSMDNGV